MVVKEREMWGKDLSKIRVVGWPRSGTHHIARLLNRYFALPSMEGVETQYCLPSHLGAEVWGIYVCRDPRDMLVSRFMQMCLRFQSSYQKFVVGRPCALEDFFREWIVEGDPHVQPIGTGWRKFTQAWQEFLLESDRFVLVRHEDLVGNRRDEFRHTLYALGADTIQESRLDAASENAGEYYRVPYTLRFQWWLDEDGRRITETVPRGRPGIWKKLLPRNVAVLLWEYCGELMLELGYGTEKEWHKLIEREENGV